MNFFHIEDGEFCQMTVRISGRRAALDEVLTDVEKKRNRSIFTIDRNG